MKTAIYLRKSRADECNAEDTLKKHKETLLEFAARNQLTVTNIYEEVVSGESIFARPEMLRLLNDLDQYEAVLCMDIDRLGRGDMQEQGLIMNRFRDSGTKIITPREVYSPGNDKDDMFFEFKGIIARNELKAIKRRMWDGRKRTVEQGGYIAEPPYGYARAWKDKIPTLSPDPEQAEIVRLIFDLYVNQGMGTYLIAEKLNQMGLHGRKGTQFSRNTVRFILQNKVYIGLIQWNKNKHIRKRSPDEKTRREIVPESEWIIVKGLHSAIVDDDLFQRAEKIRKSHSHPPSNTGEIKNPFSGLLYCKVCGEVINRQYRQKTNSPRLICPTKGCCKSVKLEEAEAQLYDAVNKFTKKCEIKIKRQEKKRSSIEPMQAAVTRLQKRLATLEAQKNKLHDLLEQGVYSIEVFMDRKNKLEDEINSVQSAIEEQKAAIKATDHLADNKQFIENAKRMLKEYWDAVPAEKNRLLKEIITRIDYCREKGEWKNSFTLDIHFKFHE